MVKTAETDEEIPDSWKTFRKNFNALHPKSPLICMAATNEHGQTVGNSVTVVKVIFPQLVNYTRSMQHNIITMVGLLCLCSGCVRNVYVTSRWDLDARFAR